jgi:hypothetical protein
VTQIIHTIQAGDIFQCTSPCPLRSQAELSSIVLLPLEDLSGSGFIFGKKRAVSSIRQTNTFRAKGMAQHGREQSEDDIPCRKIPISEKGGPRL